MAEARYAAFHGFCCIKADVKDRTSELWVESTDEGPRFMCLPLLCHGVQ